MSKRDKGEEGKQVQKVRSLAQDHTAEAQSQALEIQFTLADYVASLTFPLT